MGKYDYRAYPNLFRVAQELNRCKNPEAVMSSMLKRSYGEDFGLTVGDILGKEVNHNG